MILKCVLELELIIGNIICSFLIVFFYSKLLNDDLNKLYSPKSDQCCEYINLISLNQVRNPRCTECAEKRKYFMDSQRVSQKQNNGKPTSKPVIKNVLRKNKRLNNKVCLVNKLSS